LLRWSQIGEVWKTILPALVYVDLFKLNYIP
jgi:hypothetical protein